MVVPKRHLGCVSPVGELYHTQPPAEGWVVDATTREAYNCDLQRELLLFCVDAPMEADGGQRLSVAG